MNCPAVAGQVASVAWQVALANCWVSSVDCQVSLADQVLLVDRASLVGLVFAAARAFVANPVSPADPVFVGKDWAAVVVRRVAEAVCLAFEAVCPAAVAVCLAVAVCPVVWVVCRVSMAGAVDKREEVDSLAAVDSSGDGHA